MTSIEWLVEELVKLGYLHSKEYSNTPRVLKVIEQAKEMHKQEMKEAVLDQVTKHPRFRKIFEEQFEQYYNEKFKKD